MNHEASPQKDLVVLVADRQQERTIKTLLDERRDSLGIRPLTYDIFSHPNHDPGVYRDAGGFLAVLVRQYRYALVLLDVAWEGSPGNAQQIEKKVQDDLNHNGWEERSAVIVLDPELETWVWSHSSHVPSVLGSNWSSIRELAESEGYWRAEAAKPDRPKELLEAVLRQGRRHRSTALFAKLARKVGLRKCTDPAFVRFRKVLAEWFPASDT